MTTPSNRELGAELAARLGLTIIKREGHDLAGPCIACKSSDAFRLHSETGVGYCYSCGGKWSPVQVAETILGDRDRAQALLRQIGLRVSSQPKGTQRPEHGVVSPILQIAKQKDVRPDALIAFGANGISAKQVAFPAYGPDGKQCTTFTLHVSGNKGLFAKGKKAGLFFPHVDGEVRLPQAEETWHLVEGVKDAAALHSLGLLACGLNTCRLASKFARLFKGVHVILIPDRDTAGAEGAGDSALALHGTSASTRLAVLPAEMTEKDGADVRDVLRQPNGAELVRRAIEEAEPAKVDEAVTNPATSEASTIVDLPDGPPLTITISAVRNKPQRVVDVVRGDLKHRDRVDTDSGISRLRFLKKLAAKIGVELGVLEPLVEPVLTDLADHADGQATATALENEEGKEGLAAVATSIVQGWDLWRTPGGDAYATVPVGDHFETWAVKTKTLRHYLSKEFFEATGMPISSETLTAAMNLAEAQALFGDQVHEVFVRTVEHEGKFYIDLCNDEWQAVEITGDGWQVIDDPPVRFKRSRGMLPLPEPERGGSVDLLRKFLNVGEMAWRLVVAWLVAALSPCGPYPLLALFAEQGSGKSLAARLIRSLVDPNSAPLRSEPSSQRDLIISANNCWCLAIDNLSKIPPWLSDALCRMSTGGGFATRELYTDQDEVIFDAKRPVILTSISDVANRSDLLDRCLMVWLPRIPDEERRTEKEMFAEFDLVQPKILGALLDAVSGGLRALPATNPALLPRMADFATWVAAAETSLGWPAGTFMEAYMSNRQSANDLALESSPIGPPLLRLLEQQGEWDGSATELLEVLSKRVTDQAKSQREWPRNGQAVADLLKRLAPNLREVGWELDYDRQASRRSWVIRRAPRQRSSEVSQVSSAPPEVSQNPSRDERDAERCKVVQSDAEPDACDAGSDKGKAPPVQKKLLETRSNDTYDTYDTFAGERPDTSSVNIREWEEGTL